MYGNTIDFYILDPAILLNSFISSNHFLVDSLGFSRYNIMPSVNTVFFIFFSNLDAFCFCLLPNCSGWNLQYNVE